MAGYTKLGSFTNGTTPPINATFCNGLEDFIQQLEGDAGSVPLSGSTSGTATLRQILQGTFKLVYINTTSFRNGDAPAQTITLPVAFTSRVFLWAASMPVFELTLSDVAVQYSYYSGISSSGFAVTNITTFDKTDIQARSQGSNGAFSKISFNGSQGSASTGICTIWGI